VSRYLKPRAQFERITATQLRQSPGDILDAANSGMTFLITKAGKPWAVLSQLPGEQLCMVVESDGSIDYELTSEPVERP